MVKHTLFHSVRVLTELDNAFKAFFRAFTIGSMIILTLYSSPCFSSSTKSSSSFHLSEMYICSLEYLASWPWNSILPFLNSAGISFPDTRKLMFQAFGLYVLVLMVITMRHEPNWFEFTPPIPDSPQHSTRHLVAATRPEPRS